MIFTLTMLSFLFTSFLFIGARDEDKRIQAAADTARDTRQGISAAEAAKEFGVNVAAVEDRVRFIERKPVAFRAGRGAAVQRAKLKAARAIKQIRKNVFQIRQPDGRLTVVTGKQALANRGFTVDSRGKIKTFKSATRQNIITGLLKRQGFVVSRDRQENIIARKGDRKLIISRDDKVFDVPRTAKVDPRITLRRDIERRKAERIRVTKIEKKPRKIKGKVPPPIIKKKITKTEKLKAEIKKAAERERRSAERLARIPESFRVIPGLRGDTFLQKAGRATLSIPALATFGLGEGVGLIADKGRLTIKALSIMETRQAAFKELARAGRETPGVTAQSFDPRTPEGLVNLVFVLTVPALGALRATRVIPKSGSAKTLKKDNTITTKKNEFQINSKGTYTSTTGNRVFYQINSRIPFKQGKKGKFKITLRDSQGKVTIRKIGDTVLEIRPKPSKIIKKVVRIKRKIKKVKKKVRRIRKERKVEVKRRKDIKRVQKELNRLGLELRQIRKGQIPKKGILPKSLSEFFNRNTRVFKRINSNIGVIARLVKRQRTEAINRKIKQLDNKIFDVLKPLNFKVAKLGFKIIHKKTVISRKLLRPPKKVIAKIKKSISDLNREFARAEVDEAIFFDRVSKVPGDFSRSILSRINENLAIIRSITRDLNKANKLVLKQKFAKVEVLKRRLFKALKPLNQSLGKIGFRVKRLKRKVEVKRIDAVKEIKRRVNDLKLRSKAVSVRLVFTKARIKRVRRLISERTLLEINSRLNRAILTPTKNTLTNANNALKIFNLKLEIRRVRKQKIAAEKISRIKGKIIKLFAKGVSRVSPVNVRVKSLNIRNKVLSRRFSDLNKKLRSLERKAVRTVDDQKRIALLNRKQKRTADIVVQGINKKLVTPELKTQFEKQLLENRNRKIAFLDDIVSGRTKINVLVSIAKKPEPKPVALPPGVTRGFPTAKQRLAEIDRLNRIDKSLERVTEGKSGQAQKTVQLLKTELKKKPLTERQKQIFRRRALLKKRSLSESAKLLERAEISARSALKSRLKTKPALIIKSRIRPKLILLQKIKIETKAAVRQIPLLIRAPIIAQKVGPRQRIGPKITTKAAQKIKAKQKIKSKAIIKAATKNFLRRVLKARKLPKKVPPFIELEIEKLLKKRKVLIKRPRTQFVFRADLFSRINGLRATKAEKRKLLKIGRIFFGTELRKRVT